jgi:hypothetical protein
MSIPLPEYVPFPLYHGTSTIWEQSIREHGLGGKRIVEELRALEFHRRARACLKSVPEDWPIGTTLTMEKIDAQSVTGGGFNFRHGGVYLTPSRKTAMGYAAHNPFGSELLTYCHFLYAAHTSPPREAMPEWLEEYTELIEVLKQPGRPMLVRVNHARTKDLTDESGDPEPTNLGWLLEKTAESVVENALEDGRLVALSQAVQNQDLTNIAELISRPKKNRLSVENIFELLGQQANFEAKVVIPAGDIEFEYLRDADMLDGF